MNYRFMRLIVFFDLPMQTDKDRLSYTHFHKYLTKEGFIMMQKSVYTKLAVNGNVMAGIKADIRRNLPPVGLVEMLEVTERQFSQIEYLRGCEQTKTIDSDARFVRL